MSGKKKYITNVAEQNFHMQIKWARIQENPTVMDFNKRINEIEKEFDKELKKQLKNVEPDEKKLVEINRKKKNLENELSSFLHNSGDKYSMSKLKEFYPNYYEEFLGDFEKFFNKWLNITSNKQKTLEIKQEIKEMLENQAVTNLNANPQLIEVAENFKKNIFNKLAKYTINQSLTIANILLLSHEDSNWAAIENHIKESRKMDNLKLEYEQLKSKLNKKGQTKNKSAQKGNFKKVEKLIQKIKNVRDYKNKSFNRLAKDVGYFDGAGLRYLLKQNPEWDYYLIKLNIQSLTNTIKNFNR